MIKQAIFWITLVAGAGCAPAYVPPAPPASHPAHPEAAAAPFYARGDALPGDDVEAALAGTGTGAQDEAHDSAQGPQAGPAVRLPEAGARELRRLLNAYLALGDRLAADATGGVAEQARHFLAALDALVAVQVPERPHLWHEHAAETATMEAQAEALAASRDLQTARVAYGLLSDALERVVAVTGVPEGFDGPVHRFVCGMFAEGPRGGVWLQLGDEPRNPYFGANMLSCHREQAPVRTSGEEAREHGRHDEHGGRR